MNHNGSLGHTTDGNFMEQQECDISRNLPGCSYDCLVQETNQTSDGRGVFGKLVINRPLWHTLPSNESSNSQRVSTIPTYHQINPHGTRGKISRKLTGQGYSDVSKAKQVKLYQATSTHTFSEKFIHSFAETSFGETFVSQQTKNIGPTSRSNMRGNPNKRNPTSLIKGHIQFPSFTTSSLIESKSFSQVLSLVTYRTHSPLPQCSILPEHPSGPSILTNEHEPLTIVLEAAENALLPDNLSAFLSVVDSYGNTVGKGVRHQNIPHDKVEMNRTKNYFKIRAGVHTTSCSHYGVDLSHLDSEHGGFLFYSIKVVDKDTKVELGEFTLPPMWVVSKAPACRFQQNSVFHKIVSQNGVWTRSWRLVPGNKSYSGRHVNGKLQLRSTLHAYGPVNRVAYDEYLSTRTTLQLSDHRDGFMFQFELSPIPELNIHAITATNFDGSKQPDESNAGKVTEPVIKTNVCQQKQP